MKRRTASDRMAECIIEMVHEYRQTIEKLNSQISILESNVEYWKHKTQQSVDERDNAINDCDKKANMLGEITKIIAGITEHDEHGTIKIHLSDKLFENEVKLKRLFKLLDIPMTSEQIKDGDTDED